MKTRIFLSATVHSAFVATLHQQQTEGEINIFTSVLFSVGHLELLLRGRSGPLACHFFRRRDGLLAPFHIAKPFQIQTSGGKVVLGFQQLVPEQRACNAEMCD